MWQGTQRLALLAPRFAGAEILKLSVNYTRECMSKFLALHSHVNVMCLLIAIQLKKYFVTKYN